MMSVKAATLHENEMDISVWGTLRKMYVDIYSVIAFTLQENNEVYYATAVLSKRLAEVLVELEKDVEGIMTLDDYLTYDENESKQAEVTIKQDMDDAIETLAGTGQVLQ